MASAIKTGAKALGSPGDMQATVVYTRDAPALYAKYQASLGAVHAAVVQTYLYHNKWNLAIRYIKRQLSVQS